MRSIVAALLLVGSTTSIAQQVELVDKPCPAKATRVYITASGDIRLNGKPASLEKVKATLAGDKTQLVCYSRQNPQAYEPHPVATQILDAVMANRLPVALYWDEGFTKRVLLQ